MLQEILAQRTLQKAVWCGSGTCPPVNDRWLLLYEEIILPKRPGLPDTVKEILLKQYNPFGYPNKERGLWLELEEDRNQRYLKKKKARVVYFVGCKSSFLITQRKKPLALLKELKDTGVDFALLGEREWCCGIPLARLGKNKEFDSFRSHNLKEVLEKEAEKIIFTCPLCYSVWQDEYQVKGIELVLWR
jgi:heterodisulfide reductase subunit D